MHSEPQSASCPRAEEEGSEENLLANLLDNVENSVWHAFDYLALEGDATAPKTKLKVGSFVHASTIIRIISVGENILSSFFFVLRIV